MEAEAQSLKTCADQLAIHETIHRFTLSLDLKDWALCRACFADEIHVDYSALRGDPPGLVKADDFVALRRQALESLQTHHISANHLIQLNDDEATCTSSAIIHRRQPNSDPPVTFDTHCIYTHHLTRTARGWLIDRVKQHVLWKSGDPTIHAGARP